MRDEIAQLLLRLNAKFYQTFAGSFAETRARLQPGVRQALHDLPAQASVLDLGCGNGRLARELAQRGHQGSYFGIDACQDLLVLARHGLTHPKAHFRLADLADPQWTVGLPPSFDRLFAFAVLHHIPGCPRRLRLAEQMRELLSEEGRLVLSVWNFLASNRLKKRVLPWDTIGVKEEEVDEGDYLLDWRRGGYGLRYVHHFTPDELASLADRAGCRVKDTYHADGEGGILGLYQIWTPVRKT